MRQKSQTVDEREIHKDISRALKRGDEAQLERYSDARFIAILEAQHKRLDAMYVALLIGLIVSVFLLVVALASDTRWLWLIPLCQAPWFVLFLRIRKRRTWTLIRRRLEQLPLGTLLENSHYTLIVKVLTQRLATATNEELTVLSMEQRQKLVELSIDMATSGADDNSLPDDYARAATLGFLALATLKQSGAEHFSPTKVLPHYINLRRAIEEYQSAMRVL